MKRAHVLIAAGGVACVVALFFQRESHARASEFSAREKLATVLTRIPAPLAPRNVTFAWARVRGIEFDTQRRSLVLSAEAGQLSEELWLHELAHVRMQGARPSAPLAKRLLSALEEGVADYYAAAIAGTSKVGADGEVRDLAQPPRLDDTDWMRLALSSFEPHRLGWAFGAELYRSEARPGALLEDAVACFDGESALGAAPDSTSAAVAALLAECPERSRDRLRRLLSDWLPSEISGLESSL